jgi:hypothetical protein
MLPAPAFPLVNPLKVSGVLVLLPVSAANVVVVERVVTCAKLAVPVTAKMKMYGINLRTQTLQ